MAARPAPSVRSASTWAGFHCSRTERLPNVRITFDKFHVIGHVTPAVDKMRRIEQRDDRSLKGMRWTLLKETNCLIPGAAADVDALTAKMSV